MGAEGAAAPSGGPSAAEQAKNDELYENRGNKKKLIRLVTVMAYMFSVSFVAIALSGYYLILWTPPNPRLLHNAHLLAEPQVQFLSSEPLNLTASHERSEYSWYSLFRPENDFPKAEQRKENATKFQPERGSVEFKNRTFSEGEVIGNTITEDKSLVDETTYASADSVDHRSLLERLSTSRTTPTMPEPSTNHSDINNSVAENEIVIAPTNDYVET